MIEAKKLLFKVGTKEILKSLSFSYPDQPLLGLIGPNGAGKTTLAKSIAGLNVYSGSLLLKNREIRSLKPMERSNAFAYLPQHNFMGANIKVDQLIDQSRYKRSGDKDLKKIIIDKLHLKKLMKRNIMSLSGGELKRCYLGSTIYQRSNYIILDEPTNFLDPKFRLELAALIRQLTQNFDMRFIIASHDFDFLFNLCTSYLCLNEGKIFFQGSLESMVSNNILKNLFHVNFCIQENKGRKILTYA